MSDSNPAPSAPIIRRVAPTDVDEVARLTTLLGYPVAPEVTHSRLQRLLESPHDAVFVAERADRRLAGWIHGFLSQLLEAEYRVEIGGLIVDPESRRQGIGRQLVQALELWARSQGVREMSVRCREERQDSHRFYEELGFKTYKTQKVFRKNPLRAS